MRKKLLQTNTGMQRAPVRAKKKKKAISCLGTKVRSDACFCIFVCLFVCATVAPCALRLSCNVQRDSKPLSIVTC